MRPRAPLAYAGLLIVAFLAVIGFAAFSPSTDTSAEELVTELTATTVPPNGGMSARVASAVLALRVSDADSRTATTQAAPATTSTVPDSADETSTTVETESFVIQETSTSSTQAPPTTAAPTTSQSDTTPPTIKVTSPDDGDTVTKQTVTFKGTVEKGATVSSGPYAADVNDDGTWSIRLVVVDGANGATFTATDKAGNSASVRIIVNYEEKKAAPPPPTTTTTAAHDDHATTTPKWSPKWPADAGGIRNVEQWRSLVGKYWAADRVDCVLGIIKKESRGDPRAYNSATGASGLMQHLSKYWKNRAASAGFRDSDGLYATPYNAEANIAAGAYIAGSGDNWYTPWGYLAAYGSCPGS